MIDEPAFIQSLRALATHPAARRLADDAAVIEVGGEALVLTKDMMVEGVHWPPQQSLADVAWKLVAVNLSDLAAKGAKPVGVLLGYSLGSDDAAFLDGLKAALDAFDVPLLGGDTVSATGPRTFSLTAIGRAAHTPVPSRSGARLPRGLSSRTRCERRSVWFHLEEQRRLFSCVHIAASPLTLHVSLVCVSGSTVRGILDRDKEPPAGTVAKTHIHTFGCRAPAIAAAHRRAVRASHHVPAACPVQTPAEIFRLMRSIIGLITECLASQ